MARSCPDEIERLIESSDSKVRFEAAKQPNLRTDQIDRLSKDEGLWVRMEIASRSDLSMEQIEMLGRDKDLWVRAIIAGRPDITTEYIDILMNDEDYQVRNVIANRTDRVFTLAQIKKGLCDRHPSVRRAWNERLAEYVAREQVIDHSNHGRKTRRKGQRL